MRLYVQGFTALAALLMIVAVINQVGATASVLPNVHSSLAAFSVTESLTRLPFDR